MEAEETIISVAPNSLGMVSNYDSTYWPRHVFSFRALHHRRVWI